MTMPKASRTGSKKRPFLNTNWPHHDTASPPGVKSNSATLLLDQSYVHVKQCCREGDKQKSVILLRTHFLYLCMRKSQQRVFTGAFGHYNVQVILVEEPRYIYPWVICIVTLGSRVMQPSLLFQLLGVFMQASRSYWAELLDHR